MSVVASLPVEEVVRETLGEMVFSDAVLSEASFNWDDVVWAQVHCRQPIHGRLWIACPEPVAVELAEDAWGDEVSQDVVGQFVGEVLNTVAGQVLARVHATPEIGLPVHGRGAVDKPALTWVFEIDAGLLAVGFTPA